MTDDRTDDSPTQAWQSPPDSSPGRHPFGEVKAPPPPPSTGPSPGLALLAVGLVVVIGIIAGYVFFFSGPTGPTPSPSATPIAGTPSAVPPTATPPPGSPGPTPSTPASPSADPSSSPAVGRTPPPDIAAQIDAVAAQIPGIRELQPLRDVPYVLLTREEATAELLASLEEEVDEREIETEERLLQRLGLLPDDSDLYSLFRELYTASVAAYYRPDTGTFYVIERDDDFGPLDRMYVAHEYTHALQDQHYDLEGTRLTDNAQGDAQLAQLAAIEGDASLVMTFWALGQLSPDELAELLEDATGADPEVLARMPPILRRQLAFPYNEGLSFASEVFALGGWQAINETITDPPASTEQILHPQLYLAGEEPLEVNLADLSAALGDGWQVAYEQTMGELNTQIWLANGAEPPVIPLPGQETDWQRAAAGWGGDRLAMYEHDDGRWAIAWRIAWDEPTDLGEFEELVPGLQPVLGGPSRFGSRIIDDVPTDTVLIASDQATLQALRIAVDAASGP